MIRHQNLKKYSEPHMFCTFSLPNLLFATAACIFWTSELPKVLSEWGVLYIFPSKCAFRHSGVQFFDIRPAKSASELTCFVHFDFKMCFSPQRRAFFRHRIFKKCSEADMFCTFSLQNVFFATAACNFWFLLWAPTSAPAALTGLLFDWPDTRIIEKTQHFATSLTFAADVSSFLWLSRLCIFFLPTWLPVSSAFSTVHIVGSLLFKLPSIMTHDSESRRRTACCLPILEPGRLCPVGGETRCAEAMALNKEWKTSVWKCAARMAQRVSQLPD